MFKMKRGIHFLFYVDAHLFVKVGKWFWFVFWMVYIVFRLTLCGAGPPPRCVCSWETPEPITRKYLFIILFTFVPLSLHASMHNINTGSLCTEYSISHLYTLYSPFGYYVISYRCLYNFLTVLKTKTHSMLRISVKRETHFLPLKRLDLWIYSSKF